MLELLESADFRCARPSRVRTREGPRTVEKRYFRHHLKSALLGMWHAAQKPCGDSGNIGLFAAVGTYAKHADRCERTIRYTLRVLEQLNVLVLVHEANTVRRPATYRLNVERLEQLSLPRRGFKAHQQSAVPANIADAAPVAASLPSAHPVEASPSKESPPKPPDKRSIFRDARLALFKKYVELRKRFLPHEEALATLIREFPEFDAEEIRSKVKIMCLKQDYRAPQEPIAVKPPICEICGTMKDWNYGPGPRIACPKCLPKGKV